MRLPSVFQNRYSRSVLLLLAILLLLPNVSYAVNTITHMLHGPEQFNCSAGTSSRTFSCPSSQGAFTMNVVNGDGNGANTISSAIITINGTTVIGSKDFNANVTQINKTLTNLVKGNNTLTVQTKTCGAGSYLTLTITGVYTLDVKITSPAAGAQIIARNTPVSGTYAAYSGSNFTVKINDVAGTATAGVFNVPSVPLVPGTNVLNAVISTTDGLSDSDNVTINSNLPPVAEAGADMNVRIFDNVALDGRTSSDPESELITYQWSLVAKPQGSISVMNNADSVTPNFTPDVQGIYVPQLIVNDGFQNGAPDNLTVTALPPNTPPTALAGPDQSVITGSQVFLDGTQSFDPDGDPIAHSWRFLSLPAGSIAALDNPNDNVPTFIADQDGQYLLELVVSDGMANSLPDNVAIVSSTPNAPPIAFAGQDQTLHSGNPILLDGTGSYDPEYQPLNYAWNIVSLPAGSAVALDNAASPMPTLPTDMPGDYVVRLVVNDGQIDSAPDTVVATAVNAAPVALASASATNVPINTSVALDGSTSHDPDADPIAYAWRIASAPVDSVAGVANSTLANASFTPDKAGTYTIELVVSDGFAGSTPASVGITAYIPTVPVPDVVGMSQGDALSSILFAGLASGTITTANSDNVASGNVISQSPISGSVVPQGSSVDLIVSSGPRMVVVPTVTGMSQAAAQSAILAADLLVGGVTNANSSTVAAGNVISQSPDPGTSVIHGTAINLVVSLGPRMVSVPVLLGMTQAEAGAALSIVPLAQGNITTVYSDRVASGRVVSQNPASGTTIAQDSPVDLAVSQGPEPIVIPPDPATIAPPLDLTVATNMYSSTQFLYTGPDAIQKGVAAGTITLARAAVVRGRVVSSDNTPIPGVTVTVLNHPELGKSWTRADGMFDLAVNGGGLLTIDYGKTGYLSAQRQADVPWQDFVTIPDVVMIPFDNQATLVVAGSTEPVQVARGSVVADDRGTRQATLFFTEGTTASMVFADNSIRPLSTLNVRATEYSVGTNGPDKMPAVLPPSSGYTYCVELSVDEAMAAGAPEVRFDRPVITYLENFLGFPVGMAVPAGYYDRQAGTWIASKDGRIVKITGVTNGFADLDIDGNGAPDNAAALSALGIGDPERARLAVLYVPGATLWRVPVTHFSPWDFNLALAPPPGAEAPNTPLPISDKDIDKACTQPGSIIECENQALGEEVGVAGTPFTLNYRSNRTPGRVRSYTVRIPLSLTSVPQPLVGMKLEIEVAGRIFRKSFGNFPGQTYVFTWDGFDAYGRVPQGRQRVGIRVGYDYMGVYQRPMLAAVNFARFGGDAVLAGQIVTIWQIREVSLGNWDARGAGLGGFTLDIHHAYDPSTKELFRGDGTTRSAGNSGLIISTAIGRGNYELPYGDGGLAVNGAVVPNDVAFGPDGSAYVTDPTFSVVRKVSPDGIISTVVGKEGGAGYNGGFSGDGGPATAAKLNYPTGIAVGLDGSLYISDHLNNRIRRVNPAGIITTIAGNGATCGTTGPVGDGGPATEACLYSPNGLAVGPDNSVYITDFYHNRIRRVGTDGIITTVAGNGVFGYSGDNGIATSAMLRRPVDVEVGPDGSLYIADQTNYRVRRVSPDGRISTFAGNGSNLSSGDGGPATMAGVGNPRGLSVGSDGSLYLLDGYNYSVRRIGPDGIITRVAGNGAYGFGGDNGPATRATLNPTGGNFSGLAVSPDGSLYIADSNNCRVRKVAPSLPGLAWNDVTVPSEDGSEVYVFSGFGKHLRTLNAYTGSIGYDFSYDARGLLSQVKDASNNATLIERDPSGTAMAIVAPGGQRTALTMGSNGFLSAVSDGGGNETGFTITDNGLLTGLLDPNLNHHDFHYDNLGRLYRDEDPEGGYTTLDRVDTANGFIVTTGTAEGRTKTYEVQNLSTGQVNRYATTAAGARSAQSAFMDGTMIAVSADNTVIRRTDNPDPRFGMNAPIAGSTTVTLPGGLVATTTVSRTSNPTSGVTLTSQTDTVTVNGKSYTQAYTVSPRQYSLTTPVGRRQVATIDNVGRVTTYSVAPTVDNVLFGYDPKGRLASATQRGLSNTFGYDSMDRLSSVTDPQTHAVLYGYDNADRVSSVTLPSGRSYGFGYDAAGNTTSITMPNGAVHGLGYTKIHLDNSYTPPSNPSYGTKYNFDREWVRTTLPSGRAIDGGYDNGGRIQSTIYPEASIAFGYTDNTDRVTTFSRTSTADNATQTMAFSYDGFLTTRVASSGASTGEYRYAYNNDFAVSSFALDNMWTTLSRDNDGLLTQYGRYTIGRTGPAGAPSSLTDNTLNVGYTYDNFGRLATRTHTIAGQQRYQITLGYDNVGRISRKTEVVAGASHVFDYGYDLDGQLTDVFKDGEIDEHYTFDNNSNRTSTLAGSATYDDQDRLIQQGGLSYTFDVDGYLTNRAADTFAYSARGELLTATAGGQTVTYQYDAMARRVARTAAGATTQYLYGNPGNPFQLTASRAPDNTLTTYFYETSGNLFAFERGGQRYYVATDHLGTPKVVTDNAGNVIKQTEYDAWGVKLSDTNPALDLPVGYAGGIPESTTGLVRFGFRDYEPGTGRWDARDPILYEGGQLNLFGYVGNDPINFIDSTGLRWIYEQGTGNMYQQTGDGQPMPRGTGYSGHGEGINNLAWQNVSDKGPIPTGYWKIGPYGTHTTHTGRKLPNSMRLTPAPGTTKRAGFLMHRGNFKTMNSSHGCIVLPLDVLKRIGGSDDRDLEVIP